MKTFRDFLKEIDWKAFKKMFIPQTADMDVQQSLWGKKIRAVRPFVLFFCASTFMLQGLETQYQSEARSNVEMVLYTRLRKALEPAAYLFLDLESL